MVNEHCNLHCMNVVKWLKIDILTITELVLSQFTAWNSSFKNDSNRKKNPTHRINFNLIQTMLNKLNQPQKWARFNKFWMSKKVLIGSLMLEVNPDHKNQFFCGYHKTLKHCFKFLSGVHLRKNRAAVEDEGV